MPNNYWLHRYGYTDFHELDLSWMLDRMEYVLHEVEEFSARLDVAESDIDALEQRMTTAEERIARHEQDIHGLSTSLGNLTNRVAGIEGLAVLDAKIVESVDSMEAMNDYVALHYTEAQYTDGTPQTASKTAVIPSATSSKAGVMLPAEKAKLGVFSVSNGNATFSGKVAGLPATANSDFVTKEYVDSLAIGGSATGAYSADILTNKDMSKFSSPASFTVKDYSYGLMHEWVIDIDGFLSANVTRGENVAKAYVPTAIKPKHSFDVEMETYDNDSGTYYGGVSMTYDARTASVTVANVGDSAVTIPANAELGCYGRVVFVDVAET